MSLHIFSSVVTSYGVAANNRGETEGNITTLQKIIWHGCTHTTVSAEAIRFAIRRLLGKYEKTNRRWDEDRRINVWRDENFKCWEDQDGNVFIDDDLLGFMTTDGAGREAEPANARRAVLEVTRAVSLTPWPGDFTFNAASPRATLRKREGKQTREEKNPVPYGTEVHATRYQFGVALTPKHLRRKDRAAKAIRTLADLRTVAGNHARFLYDFSPEVVVFRITEDPAPRILYCFETRDEGKTVHAPSLVSRIRTGDIAPQEVIFGGTACAEQLAEELRDCGVKCIFPGVKQAVEEACQRIDQHLDIKG